MKAAAAAGGHDLHRVNWRNIPISQCLLAGHVLCRCWPRDDQMTAGWASLASRWALLAVQAMDSSVVSTTIRLTPGLQEPLRDDQTYIPGLLNRWAAGKR